MTVVGLTVRQVAKLLRCSDQYVRRLCGLPKHDARHIECVRLHARTIVVTDRKLIEEYFKKFGKAEGSKFYTGTVK